MSKNRERAERMSRWNLFLIILLVLSAVIFVIGELL